MLRGLHVPVLLGAGVTSYLVTIELLHRWRALYMARLVEDTLADTGAGSTWRVHNLLTANELRWEAWVAMSARGLLSTYAIPTISGVLLQTGGFSNDVQRRYADMELLIREFSENAADGEERWAGQPDRARKAIQRLNAIHDKYGSLILPRDMRYVLAVFMCTPALWCRGEGTGAGSAGGAGGTGLGLGLWNWLAGGTKGARAHRWACRAMTKQEEQCVFRHWMGIGAMMRIHGLAWGSLDDAVTFKREYEAKYQRYKVSNRRVALATVEYFLQQYPSAARPLVRLVVLQALSALQVYV